MNAIVRPVALVVVLLAVRAGLAAGPAAKVHFEKTTLDTKFRSEGTAVGDFNHDGKLDISAGGVYYAAPDWKLVPILAEPKEYDPHGYANSFCNFADDLNGDGWTDLLVADFPSDETWWFENPQTAAGPWKRHTCIQVTNNESPAYLDIDGDGRRELVCASAPNPEDFDGPDRQMGISKPGASPSDMWTFRPISAKAAPGTQRYDHGLGVGDINSDGRNDVLVREGWWEAPADRSAVEWKFHPANFGETCAHMFAFDFDGDGDQDVLSSAAHHFGIWWHEQASGGWETHTIDKTYSQTHALCLADINSDGLPDFVTGKRWWAHGPTGDPGSDQPAVLYWYELSRHEGKPQWTAHIIDDDSGIGTQFEVADIDGDKLLDVVTANKKGAHFFRQVRD